MRARFWAQVVVCALTAAIVDDGSGYVDEQRLNRGARKVVRFGERPGWPWLCFENLAAKTKRDHNRPVFSGGDPFAQKTAKDSSDLNTASP